MIKSPLIITGFLVTSFAGMSLISPTAGELPKEVNSFYENWNFVSSFSSLEERHRLVQFGTGFAQESMRLKVVADRLDLLLRRVLRLDPDMIRWSGVSPRAEYRSPYSGTGSARLQPNRTASGFFPISSELVDIGSSQRCPGGFTLKTTLYPISDHLNISWISLFEGEKSPSLEQRFRQVEAAYARTEYHRWRMVAGTWMVEEVRIVMTGRDN